MTKLKDHTWMLRGQCINVKYPKIHDGDIVLPEQASRLGIHPHTPPKPITQSAIAPEAFGRPIKADLAVKFIEKGYTSIHAFFSKFLNSLHDDKEKQEAEEIIENLKNLAYGVAFDRSVILKILSQPNCEGIRSYLCGRDNKGEIHYSLVMVGIDADGYDLNYPPATVSPSSLDSKDFATGSVETKSLVVEYGNPPGGKKLLRKGVDASIDEHMYLLKSALGK